MRTLVDIEQFFSFLVLNEKIPPPSVMSFYIEFHPVFSSIKLYSNDFIRFIYRETNPQNFLSQDVVHICYFSFSKEGGNGKE